jgi:hypothetical protein
MGNFDSDDLTGFIAYASVASASAVNSEKGSSIAINTVDLSSTGTLPGLRSQLYT